MLDIGTAIIEAVKNGKETLEKTAPKSLRYIFLDAIIIGLIALFAVAPVQIPCTEDLYVMLKAFAIAFVFELAVERGLKKKTGD